jgi:hypothetical protein
LKKVLICDLRIENNSYSHNIRDNERFKDYLISLGFRTYKLYSNSLKTKNHENKKHLKIYELFVKLPLKRIRIVKEMRGMNVLFFPSINFEDLFYLYWLLKSVKRKTEVNGIILRVISVDAERVLSNRMRRSVIHYAIQKIMRLGMSVRFTVETKEAALYVLSLTGLVFEWLPTPINSTSINRNKSNLTLFLPGKPRLDKGSLQINSYKKILDNQQSPIQIISQKIDSESNEDQELKELKVALSNTDYKKAIGAATWLFAPHILDVFRIRGSALLTDSLENRIPLLARKGTSLGNFVDEFKIGHTFTDLSDFYSTISRLEMDLLSDYNDAFDSAINEINGKVKSCLEYCL